MTRARDARILQRAGAHLYQVSAHEWCVTGTESAMVRRQLTAQGHYRWCVSMENLPRGNWTDCANALAHAYALATGHSNT